MAIESQFLLLLSFLDVKLPHLTHLTVILSLSHTLSVALADSSTKWLEPHIFLVHQTPTYVFGLSAQVCELYVLFRRRATMLLLHFLRLLTILFSSHTLSSWLEPHISYIHQTVTHVFELSAQVHVLFRRCAAMLLLHLLHLLHRQFDGKSVGNGYLLLSSISCHSQTEWYNSAFRSYISTPRGLWLRMGRLAVYAIIAGLSMYTLRGLIICADDRQRFFKYNTPVTEYFDSGWIFAVNIDICGHPRARTNFIPT